MPKVINDAVAGTRRAQTSPTDSFALKLLSRLCEFSRSIPIRMAARSALPLLLLPTAVKSRAAPIGDRARELHKYVRKLHFAHYGASAHLHANGEWSL